MRRFLFGVLLCLTLCSTAMPADTPAVEAVKEAIQSLKDKRASVKDKGDQALLDTAIKDLEERLAQVGSETKADDKKGGKEGEPVALPKNWELKFNTGKSRPTYDAKTGVLKLVYDFSDAKQLKDFEFEKEVKPQVQKGALTIKGGEEIKHLVHFSTISVGCIVVIGATDKPLQTSGGYWLYAAGNNQNTIIDVCFGKEGDRDTFIAGKGVGRNVLGNGMPVTITDWFVSETKTGLKATGIDVSGKKKTDAAAGRLILSAKSAPNQYQRLTISGTLDPEWAKEFFADKK